jgi:hypothetical protein
MSKTPPRAPASLTVRPTMYVAAALDERLAWPTTRKLRALRLAATRGPTQFREVKSTGIAAGAT